MKKFVGASIALRIDVAVDFVGIDNRAQALKLIDHLVNATREQHQLHVVDKEQRWFVNKRSRVSAMEISGVLMA